MLFLFTVKLGRNEEIVYGNGDGGVLSRFGEPGLYLREGIQVKEAA